MAREAQAEVKEKLFELLVQVLARVFLLDEPDEDLERLFRDDAALERAIDFTSSLVSTGNVLGHSPKTNIDLWVDSKARDFVLKRDEEWDVGERSMSNQTPTMPRPTLEHGKGKPPQVLEDPSGVKHTQMETVSLIREQLWDRAQWSGTGFFLAHEDAAPPILGLLFKDRVAAGEIFADWRKELGLCDENERLRVTIVRGISKLNPFSYRFLIATMPAAEVLRPDVLYFTLSRMKTLEPKTDFYLNKFLLSYQRVGAFTLVPMILVEQNAEPDLLKEYQILKRNLHVRQAWEIGRKDKDSVGILDDDDPIIPGDQPNAPVLDLLRWRRSGMSK
jgi:hypothetical protein